MQTVYFHLFRARPSFGANIIGGEKNDDLGQRLSDVNFILKLSDDVNSGTTTALPKEVRVI